MTPTENQPIVPPHCRYPWTPDRGDGTYANPILCADYSDLDVIRDGENFWLTASSFNCTPGLPILHSRDLVNWTIANYAIRNNPDPRGVFDLPQHGCGVWAPAIRKHAGLFWIFFPLPDEGIYVTTAADPRGQWSEPWCLIEGKGFIDPCPLWDDDGKAYLVHAYANSRCGIKHRLRVVEMTPDAQRLIGEGKIVFDQPERHPTCEGPKLHKRNGYYYLSAPAGGVKHGWQLILRSRQVFGPYEEKVVLAQRDTPINGPHQGALVDLSATSDHAAFDSPPLAGVREAKPDPRAGGGGERQSKQPEALRTPDPHPNPLPAYRERGPNLEYRERGPQSASDSSSLSPPPSSLPEDWFLHFQDADMFGRIVHLQPVRWENDWPLIGIDQDASGLGKPVHTHRKPNVPTQPITIPQTSDDFAAPTLGLQWQWHANHRDDWHCLCGCPGACTHDPRGTTVARVNDYVAPGHPRALWLRAVKASANFSEVPNLLLQKFPATAFSVEADIELDTRDDNVDAGLIIMGLAHAAIALSNRRGTTVAALLVNDVEQCALELDKPSARLRVGVQSTGICQFSIHWDGRGFVPIGEAFQSTPGKWIGAKVGVWCRSTVDGATGGAYVRSFRFTGD